MFVCSATTRPPAKFSSSFPQTAKAKDKPKQPLPSPPPPLPSHPPVSLFSLIRELANTKGGRGESEPKRKSPGARPHERDRIKPRRWWRRPGRGEGWGGGFEERSGSGCYFTDKTLCPLPLSPRQLGLGVASFAFSLLVFSPSLMLSMRALYELEEGYEVPFGCHWHVKRVWWWQLTRSWACN